MVLSFASRRKVDRMRTVKIGIFDPYLDTLGGGEKYILTAAKCLSKTNDVFIFWDPKLELDVKSKAIQRFGIDLSDINFTSNIFDGKTPFLKKLLLTRKYDVIIYLSDGSIPFLLAKKNILLFQFPVNWIDARNFLTKFKLKKISKIICYSNFVKNFLDKTFSINSIVLPPSIDVIKSKSFKKENVILTVGRFTKAVNAKKQEVLIDVFKEMYDRGLLDWKFLIVGSVLQKDRFYLTELRHRAKGYPIDILDNISLSEIRNCYKRAKIYWHAAGFGEDLDKYPERAEHFGISTVEAMSAGAVSVVINAGGQKEIVKEGETGFLWDTLEELELKTLKLTKDDKLLNKLSGKASQFADRFGSERFCKEINELILQ